MDCRQCSDELTAYIDGELADSLAQQMKVHLDKCPPCESEYRDLKNAGSFVETHAAALEPMPEIWNNLRSRILAMPPPTNSLGFFRFMALNRWAAATATLAATIMLALGIWGYLQYQNSQRGLQSYMDQYIEMRSVTERIHSRQLLRVEANSGVSEADAAVIEENPFAVGSNPFTHTQNVSFNNPFRTEER